MIKRSEREAGALVVVQNWLEELEERVPTDR